MIVYKTAGVYKTEDQEHYIFVPVTVKIDIGEYERLCELIEEDKQQLIDEIIKEILKKEINKE